MKKKILAQLLLSTIFILIFNACSNKKTAISHKIVEKIVYVEANLPKLKVLPEVPVYKLAVTYDKNNSTYVLVEKNDLNKASYTTRNVRRQNKFYILQNRDFNRKFYYAKEKK